MGINFRFNHILTPLGTRAPNFVHTKANADQLALRARLAIGGLFGVVKQPNAPLNLPDFTAQVGGCADMARGPKGFDANSQEASP